MDINSIRLPQHLVADLYKKSLVEISSEKLIPLAEDSNTEWKFLGENRKQVLIIVNYQDAVFLPDQQLNFLIALLTACKLGLGDVAVFNLNHHPDADYSKLIKNFSSKTVLLFGTGPSDLKMPVFFPEFQVQVYNHITHLFSPSLEQAEPDKVIKSKLWVCLKKIFNL